MYSNKLSPYENKILDEMIEILTPFEVATNFTQGQNIVTSSSYTMYKGSSR